MLDAPADGIGGEETLKIAMDYDLLPAKVPAMVVQRASGDHPTVSTNKDMQRDEAEMALNWFRATLYHDKAAARTLTTVICDGCDPKIWTATSKNFGGK